MTVVSTSKLDYGGGSSPLTATALNSLATSSTLTVGMETDAIVNTTTLATDYAVYFAIKVGAAPTAGTIKIFAIGCEDNTNFEAGATGSNAALTPAPVDVLQLLQSIPTTNTASITYKWVCKSLLRYLGGIPKKVNFFITHNTVQALASSGHTVSYTPYLFTGNA